MRVTVTGANGFIGCELVKQLKDSAVETVALVRNGNLAPGTKAVDYQNSNALADALHGTHTLIHLIGKAHTGNGSAEEYRATNVALSVQVAKAAIAAGVKRFIFLSSIKVLGENTPPGKPFNQASLPQPEDDYGRSKLEAEQALHQLFKDSQVELLIIRPPLVWGEQPKGNLATILRWTKKGIPLPLAGIKNRRQWVSLSRLCDFIVFLSLCKYPLKGVPPLLIADSKAISTGEVVSKIAKFAGLTARLFPLPRIVWSMLRQIPPTRAAANKLSGNLEIDASETETLTGWQPAQEPE